MNDKTNSGHQFSEGGEVPKLTKEQAIVSKLKNIKPDFDHEESYQHGFHDGVDVAIDMIESSTRSVAAPKPDGLIEKAFMAGRSKTSWEQFKIDNKIDYEDVQKKDEELRQSVKELLVLSERWYLSLSQSSPEFSSGYEHLKDIESIFSRAKALLEH